LFSTAIEFVELELALVGPAENRMDIAAVYDGRERAFYD
jgi:hypothetical protein